MPVIYQQRPLRLILCAKTNRFSKTIQQTGVHLIQIGHLGQLPKDERLYDVILIDMGTTFALDVHSKRPTLLMMNEQNLDFDALTTTRHGSRNYRGGQFTEIFMEDQLPKVIEYWKT